MPSEVDFALIRELVLYKDKNGKGWCKRSLRKFRWFRRMTSWVTPLKFYNLDRILLQSTLYEQFLRNHDQVVKLGFTKNQIRIDFCGCGIHVLRTSLPLYRRSCATSLSTLVCIRLYEADYIKCYKLMDFSTQIAS